LAQDQQKIIDILGGGAKTNISMFFPPSHFSSNEIVNLIQGSTTQPSQMNLPANALSDS